MSYQLTRFVLLRLLGLVYAVAFLVAINQIVPLIGAEGLTPIGLYVDRLRGYFGSPHAGFFHLPSLFWFGHSDAALIAWAWAGFGLSCLVLAGFANALMLAALWLIYMSYVHLGQVWYGYGWETQLLETGFLAIFLCPLLDARPFPRQPPPVAIIWLFRWLTFRIMLGSGLIKIRGDSIWRDLTALYYHFETQPLPNPLSQWFHFLPRLILRLGVQFNFLAELVAPWFVFWPRIARHAAGIVIIAFQVTLIVGGNLSFLNWLTIIPALACFDDSFWAKVLPRGLVRWAQRQSSTPTESGSASRGHGLEAHATSENATSENPTSEGATSEKHSVNAIEGPQSAVARASSPCPRRLATPKIIAWVVAALVAVLSIKPVVNLVFPGKGGQLMNASFDPLDLVNTYGAFGSVGRERLNVIFEGTDDPIPYDHADWKPYPYKGLPVDLDKRPPQIAPYQLRLDWQMWFAAMGTPQDYPFTINVVWKLLHNDPGTLGLFAGNPFPGKPPRWVRAVEYRYKFVDPKKAPPRQVGASLKMAGGTPALLHGRYWSREQLGLWLPPLSADNEKLQHYVRESGWVK